MKVSELETGRITDGLVALAQRWKLNPYTPIGGEDRPQWVDSNGIFESFLDEYQPSTNGGQCFELMEKYCVNVIARAISTQPIYWEAQCGNLYEGSTLALAICKAVIASKWGYEIPEEIVKQIGE